MDIDQHTPLSERLLDELDTLGLFVLLAGIGGVLGWAIPPLTSAHPTRDALPLVDVVQFVVTILTIGLICYAWRVYRPPQPQSAPKPKTVGGIAKTVLLNYLIWPGGYTVAILYELAVHGKQAAVPTVSGIWWTPVMVSGVYLLWFVLEASKKAFAGLVQKRIERR